MTAWKNPTTSPPTASTSGVLRPDELARHIDLRRFPSGPAVDRWVENHWSLRWDLPIGGHYVSQVLPHPTCSLTIEVGSHPRPDVPAGVTVVITGVVTKRFDVDITGWGRVVGVRFRPGGLATLTGRPASAWTDRTVAATDVLPRVRCDTLADPDLADDPDAWAAAAEDAIVDLGAPDERYDLVLTIVADMLADRTLLTVRDVCGRHAVSERTLQRLFTHYVGVGPKFVLARYRMHDVVAALDAGYEGTLTDLAVELGWYDQAHFTRDFTALVGVPPSAYRAGP